MSRTPSHIDAGRADVQGKRVTVIGAARSGLAVARLLAGRGADVFVTEHGALADDARADLETADIAVESGGHTERALDADFVAISPGVPDSTPIVQQAMERGLPIYSEVEVAAWFCDAPILAITGSNGKTTTTSLAAHIVRTAGRPLVLAGNIGTAFADRVDACDADATVVLEVSSFQLDHVDGFRPKVAVLLNITPDHLDRYDGDFDKYAASKLRIAENLEPGDVFVYNHDDDRCRAHGERVAERGVTCYPFSLDHDLDRGAFVRDGEIVLRLTAPTPPAAAGAHPSPMEEVLMPSQHLALRGRHNLYNSLAAAISARAMEISSDVVRESLASFEGVPHRLEMVREVGGVKYVNDSKATNVNAVWYALESFDAPMVLIAGGRDKGNDYSPIMDLVGERCRGVIGLGESGDKVLRELGDFAKAAARAHTMEEAIQFARLMAEPGDVVLLSPACASFDMYANYEARGDEFKRLVQNL